MAADAESGQAPTLVGALSHCPSKALARIAEETGTQESSLATLTVLHSAPQLYNAVLEYAGLSTPENPSEHFPIMVDALENRSDFSDDDDTILLSKVHLAMRNARSAIFDRRHRGARLVAGKGPRRRKVPVPKFKMSIGEAQVLWPPPSHLSVQNIIAEREKKKKERRLAKKRASRGEDPEGADDDEKKETDSEAVKMEVSSPEEKDVKDASITRNTIYILHYAVGEPQPVCMGGLQTHREILLVSADGNECLKKFSVEVIRWRLDKDFRGGDGKSFALHRFKTRRFGGMWEFEGMKQARPPSSVILEEGQMNAILEDVRKFISSETRKWYIKHGLPHRRSYLFYGHPGTGKTSTVRAIASTFRLNCCYLNMTNAQFSNQVLGDALSQIPANALIVLEDVDALFNEDRRNEQGIALTFSGLLNALDGLISADGVVTIMTTNHIDRLDKALIRGGRVDRRFLFGKPTQGQIEDLFRSFYPSSADSLAKKFSDMVLSRPEGDEAKAISTLQQIFIDHRESTAEECVAAVSEFYEAHFPEGTIGAKQSFYT